MTRPEPALMDWRVYADATCAGLSALMPIPGVDLLFETVFRRRMPGSIARARGSEVDARTRRLLGRHAGQWLSMGGCVAVPLLIVKSVAKRIWRKLVYVLAVADAAEQLSEYWHRAFLIDHVIRSGHAAPDVDVEHTAALVNHVLDTADTSALKGIARQMVVGARHVPSLLRRARRRQAEDVTSRQEDFLRSHWDVVYASLSRVALRYNELYSVWRP